MTSPLEQLVPPDTPQTRILSQALTLSCLRVPLAAPSLHPLNRGFLPLSCQEGNTFAHHTPLFLSLPPFPLSRHPRVNKTKKGKRNIQSCLKDMASLKGSAVIWGLIPDIFLCGRGCAFGSRHDLKEDGDSVKQKGGLGIFEACSRWQVQLGGGSTLTVGDCAQGWRRGRCYIESSVPCLCIYWGVGGRSSSLCTDLQSTMDPKILV